MKQQQALDILKMGQNVFLTGRAGAGKTYVLNEYIQYLKSNHIPVAITASTGIAATHLNGTTIHSWSGVGIKDKISEPELKKLLKKPYLRQHYLDTAVLIIDEVSMLHAHQLDLVNELCKIFRHDDRPFGGMQVVLSGDFFQLPPVGRGSEKVKFVIESDAWKEMKLRACYLTEQFRQDDTKFLNILNEIRSGEVSHKSRKLLEEKINQKNKHFIEPTKLYTHNIDVDEINLIELSKINDESRNYGMTCRGTEGLVDILKKGCLAPETLSLKIGAKVMFVKNNFELGIVNGTLGEVIGFDEETRFPEVQIKTGEIILVKPDIWIIDDGEDILAELRQLPLRLAWAITVHKSQGMSLDLAEIDLSKSFTPGMGYVALSRVRNFDGLKLEGYNEMALQIDPKILPFDKKLQETSDNNIELLGRLSTSEIKKRHDDFVQKNTILCRPKKALRLRSGTASQPKLNKYTTLELVNQKLSLAEMAEKLNFKPNTILTHLEKLIDLGEQIDMQYLMPEKKIYQKIKQAFENVGLEKLKPVFEELKEEYSYDVLKLVRLNLKNLKG